MADALPTTEQDRIDALEALLTQERTALAAERAARAADLARISELTKERDRLRDSHQQLRIELELLRRRIFIAKAERVDTRQLELDFAATLAALDKVSGGSPKEIAAIAQSERPSRKSKKKPRGRRDLRELPLEEERFELVDDDFERLVAEGKAERCGFEESCKVGWKRGGMRRVVIARAKYRVVDVHGLSYIETTPMPPECFPRSLAAPSMLAHVATEKCCDGMPLNRVEDRLARDGVRVDRGTMSRWLDDAGATVGATVVAAAHQEAWRTAFCISTDATGIAVQPGKKPEGGRQACRRGHYFVLIADRDHIFFEYTPRETSACLEEMFRGYSGYVQADAKSVYDVLFREPDKPPPDETEVRHEVGCWAHCRRKFWEATCAKSELAREGLARIAYIFMYEDAWRADPPEVILRLRRQHLAPQLEAFFAWAEAHYQEVREQRGLLRSALGYAVRQKDALMRVLDDGRLALENNKSERELRRIAVGRKGWLFVGSDDHAESTGHLFSLIASARLHRLDPEGYLRDLFRVLAHWPRDRYLELAPKYWSQTRARLDPGELAAEVGPLTVPPPFPAPAEQQPATD
jgi:transposase